MAPMDANLTLITAERLSEYFESKRVSPHCSLCGHLHFTVPQVGVTGVAAAGMRIGPYVNVIKAESIYHEDTNNYYISIICKNCGNVVMIDSLQILEWLKQRYPAIMEKGSNEQTK
ncbi:hypothetical protein Xbed_03465 [Xenorhabdus beddingii]|uniref:Uncharacterized protein n=1 Tax=Xenorhabdus beddingii TaxID=40578 RepID=A0A1Y2SCZ6_9GAMM|nr:hypothetical protein [Xenorhabdus beddingii]OTA16538.1 hypothetical protein Xbed_03465 [Xenorhabdus beddingii]